MLSMLEKGLDEEHVTLLIDTQELIINIWKIIIKISSRWHPTTEKDKYQVGFLLIANLWKVVVDINKQHAFPIQINLTALRPDILMYSPSIRDIIAIELTCPCEELWKHGIQSSLKNISYLCIPSNKKKIKMMGSWSLCCESRSSRIPLWKCLKLFEETRIPPKIVWINIKNSGSQIYDIFLFIFG